MPREPIVVTLGIFYISNLLYRRCANGILFFFCYAGLCIIHNLRRREWTALVKKEPLTLYDTLWETSPWLS